MTDQYDEAVAKVKALKAEYAEHKEQQRQQRKPLMTALAGICALVIASLLYSSGFFGAGLLLTGIAVAAFIIAFRQRKALT